MATEMGLQHARRISSLQRPQPIDTFNSDRERETKLIEAADGSGERRTGSY